MPYSTILHDILLYFNSSTLCGIVVYDAIPYYITVDHTILYYNRLQYVA